MSKGIWHLFYRFATRSIRGCVQGLIWAYIAMTKTQSEASLCKDYFTMPFIVLDKSLHTSGKGSKEFDLLDGDESALLSMDAMIHNVFSHEEPIVITSQSFESLLPCKEIDESVCDLCLKWWVFTHPHSFIITYYSTFEKHVLSCQWFYTHK